MTAPRDYPLSFSGAGAQPVAAKGKQVRVLEAPVSYLWIQLDHQTELKRRAGQAINAPGGFERLTVRSEVAQDVLLTVSDYEQSDNSSAVVASVNAAVEPSSAYDNLPKVSVPAGGAAKLCDGDTTRKALRLMIPSTEAGPLWIGGATIATDHGAYLEQGVVDYMDSQAETWAFNPNGSAVVVTVLSLKRP